MAGKVTREYNVSIDIHGLSAHPMGEMAGKVTREYNVSMYIHGLSVHPMGEMAGKVTWDYNVSISMDCPCTPWGTRDGWKSYSGIQCIHGYPWTIRAPHGGDGWKSYSGIQCIHGYPWTIRAPHGRDGWKSYSGIQCQALHARPPASPCPPSKPKDGGKMQPTVLQLFSGWLDACLEHQNSAVSECGTDSCFF